MIMESLFNVFWIGVAAGPIFSILSCVVGFYILLREQKNKYTDSDIHVVLAKEEMRLKVPFGFFCLMGGLLSLYFFTANREIALSAPARVSAGIQTELCAHESEVLSMRMFGNEIDQDYEYVARALNELEESGIESGIDGLNVSRLLGVFEKNETLTKATKVLLAKTAFGSEVIDKYCSARKGGNWTDEKKKSPMYGKIDDFMAARFESSE